jgi:PASTA domain
MPDDQQEPREPGAAAGDDAPAREAGPDETAPMPAADRPDGVRDEAGPGDTAPMSAVDEPDGVRDEGPAPDETVPMRAAGPDQTAPMPAAGGTWSGRAGVPAPAPPRPPGPAPGWEHREPDDGRRWWAPIVIGLVALLLLGVLGFGLWLIFAANDGQTPSGPTPSTSAPRTTRSTKPPTTTRQPPPTTVAAQVPVPPLVGLKTVDAQAELDRLGLTYRLQFRPSDSPPGTVVSTDPGAGSLVPAGSKVTLVIATERKTTQPPTKPATTSPSPED